MAHKRLESHNEQDVLDWSNQYKAKERTKAQEVADEMKKVPPIVQ